MAKIIEAAERVESFFVRKTTSTQNRINAARYGKFTNTEKCIGFLLLYLDTEISYKQLIIELNGYSNAIVTRAINAVEKYRCVNLTI